MKDRLSKAGLFSIDMEKGYNKFMLKKNIRSVKLIRTERGIQMKKDVFQNCPIYQSDRFEIRKMEMKDAHELFRCYSNPQAARYFNGDCCGDDFYYTDYEKFLECMKFWESRYQVRDFVRFTIVDQKQKEIAGMVEICPSYKYSADGSKIGILRIDLLPEYENEKMIKELLTVILEHIYEDFEVQAYATARRSILKQFHFVAAMDECNISFRDYFIRF